MSFDSLGLSPALLRALREQGYESPTPVQAEAIPLVLTGGDLLAGAQTGTGKTAAFSLPMLQRLFPNGACARQERRHVRALVLTPTRELALQVHESVRAYAQHLPLASTTIFGGVGMGGQLQVLRRGVDLLVATPGRLIDHIGQKSVDLRRIEILVLDEADRMLDMGFLPALKKILAALPRERQTLLFSATFPEAIRKLAAEFTHAPAQVQIARENSVAATVAHRVHPVDAERKRELLIDLLAADTRRQTLVFVRTKHGANRLARQLDHAGIKADAIHGDKSQGARQRALGDFKNGRLHVLVATDIAARGIDIDQLPVVINHDLPMVAEDYVHRIGRTGRNGATGLALSLVCQAEEAQLHAIQKLIGQPIEVCTAPGFEPRQPVRTQATAPRAPGGKTRHARRPHAPAKPGASHHPGKDKRPQGSRHPAARQGEARPPRG